MGFSSIIGFCGPDGASYGLRNGRLNVKGREMGFSRSIGFCGLDGASYGLRNGLFSSSIGFCGLDGASYGLKNGLFSSSIVFCGLDGARNGLFSSSIGFCGLDGASYGLSNGLLNVKGRLGNLQTDSKLGLVAKSGGFFGVTLNSSVHLLATKTVPVLGLKLCCGHKDFVGGDLSDILQSPALAPLTSPIACDKALSFKSIIDNLNYRPLFRLETNMVIKDGKIISEEILSKLAIRVGQMKKIPCLGIVLASGNRRSKAFVEKLMNACEETGIKFVLTELREDCSEGEFMSSIQKLDQDSSIDGIHLQVVDDLKVLNTVSADKDIDGVQKDSISDLLTIGREPQFIAPSPKGCLEILIRSGVQLPGTHITVIGETLVASQVTHLLRRHRASAYHVKPSRVKLLLVKEIVKHAEIMVQDTATANPIPREWMKDAVIMDVGKCPIGNTSNEYITIAMILFNTVKAAIKGKAGD